MQADQCCIHQFRQVGLPLSDFCHLTDTVCDLSVCACGSMPCVHAKQPCTATCRPDVTSSVECAAHPASGACACLLLPAGPPSSPLSARTWSLLRCAGLMDTEPAQARQEWAQPPTHCCSHHCQIISIASTAPGTAGDLKGGNFTADRQGKPMLCRLLGLPQHPTMHT